MGVEKSQSDEAFALERVAAAAREVQAASIVLQAHFAKVRSMDEYKAAGRLRGNRPKRKSALKDRAFIPRVTDRTIGCSSALRECPVNSRLCGL